MARMPDSDQVYDSNNYLNYYGESYSEVYGPDPEEDSYLDNYLSDTESEDDTDPDVIALQEDTNSFYLETSKYTPGKLVFWLTPPPLIPRD